MKRGNATVVLVLLVLMSIVAIAGMKYVGPASSATSAISINGAVIAITGAASESSSQACSDGIDNDNDGKTDCADDDCCAYNPNTGATTCIKDGTCSTACGADASCNGKSPSSTLAVCGAGNTGVPDQCDFRCTLKDQTYCSVSCDSTATECSGKEPGSCSGYGISGKICSTTDCKETTTGVPAENTEATCSDEKDNDCDGRTDCRDASCTYKACGGITACPIGSTGSSCNNVCDAGSGTCTCAPTCTETACGDGIDNDNDGNIDCADPDCNNDANCFAGEICSNNIDDDSDSQIDCLDADCDTKICGGTTNCPSGATGNSCNNVCGNLICGCTPSCTETNCNDNVDNDGDGKIDSADSDCFACTPDTTRPCGNSIGECKNAIQTCDANGNWGICSKTPATETCNNKDDDCDNQTDENIIESQTCGAGICSGGTQTRTCTAGAFGAWSTCPTDGNKTNETCNGLDDDCDGTVDNGFTLKTFYKDSDGDTYGKSTDTIQACAASAGYVNNSMDCDDTKSAVKPGVTEICNNKIDDNCNGITDGTSEGCTAEPEQDLEDQIIPNPKAGNGICEAGETKFTTPVDCGCPAGKQLVGTDCKDTVEVLQEEKTQVCGNDAVEGIEECDGIDNTQCPGACNTDCKCKFKVADGICNKGAGENSENSAEDCAFKYSGLVILLAILFAVVGGVAGYWYFKIAPRGGVGAEEFPELKGPDDVSKSDAVDTIESYIRKTAAMGFTPKQIRAALVDKGWDVDLVDERIASLISEEEPE